MQWAVWGVVAATSLALSTPLKAQNNGANSEPMNNTGPGAWQHGKTLGHLERARKLIGQEVVSSDSQRVGKLNDFAVDLNSGRILYAIVGTGGFLGAGEHLVAVPPEMFTQPEANNIQLKVDKQKFSSAPEVTREMERSEAMGQSSFLTQVYQFYGQTPHWLSSGTEGKTFNAALRVNYLLGTKIENASNTTIGKLYDFALDLAPGRAVFVALSPESGTGLGDNLYAVPPSLLTWNADQKVLTTDITNEKLQAAPHFAKDDWSNLSNPSFAAQVYQYYGKQPFFQTGGIQESTTPSLRPTGRTKENQQQP